MNKLRLLTNGLAKVRKLRKANIKILFNKIVPF